MKPLLCLLKTYPINVTNLFLAGICHSQPNILGSCQYAFNDQGFFELEIGSTVRMLSPTCPETSFRRLCWNDRNLLDQLDSLLDICEQQQKILCFGSHQTADIQYLKSRLGERCITVGITYQENLYSLLLDNMARYHIFMLEQRMIEPNQWDQEHMHALERPALIQHYVTEFDRQNLIEHESQLNLDYNFIMDDYFDPDRLVEHYMALGFDREDRFREYHSEWLSASRLDSDFWPPC